VHVELHPDFAATDHGRRAQELTRACVHCGFCLATCPTYLELRDERDSPRGRIYLIRQLLESGEASARTRTHLDRCLTCRNCETTCPSGMQYGQLLDIGRELMEERVPRPPPARLLRQLLRAVFSRPGLLTPALRLGQLLRPLLPGALKSLVPPRQRVGPLPATTHSRCMLLLEGCVQRAATPATNAAARRVFDRLGISLASAAGAGCCGAIHQHLGDPHAARAAVRRNIDAWWPAIERGAEAVVSCATGCGSMLADYGRLLADDPAYAEKAARISALARDAGEVLQGEELERLAVDRAVGRVAVHTPCSLQHGLKQPALIRQVLTRAGVELAATREDHLCCGSAGTYSLLQPGLSRRLRERKLDALTGDAPDLIATGNIGCQLHLQGGGDTPVVHWLELLDG